MADISSIFKKTAVYTVLGAITAPIWVPLGLMGIASMQTMRLAVRYPKATTAAVGACCAMLYLSSPYGKQVRAEAQETIVRTVTNSQKMRADALEERLATTMREMRTQSDNAREYASQLTIARRELAQYRDDRESYLLEIGRLRSTTAGNAGKN